MKKIRKTLLLTFVLIVASFGMTTVHAYDNFVIDTYLVNIDVLENNVFEIEEIIYADFEYESHGIYREIPYRGILSRTVEGEKIETKYNAVISDIEVIGQKYTTDKSGNNQIIKIGDKDKYIIGMQKYHIKYTMDFGDDGIDDFDEFYFNVIGTGWTTYINKCAVTINMPKEFDAENIGISTGYAGESGSSIVKYQINGETLIIHTRDVLYPYEGMNVRIHLPEGYFENERIPTDWAKVFRYFAIGLTGLVFLVWLTTGRDGKLYPSVEFYPPEGLTPAEVGYIIDGYLDTKDVLSLLIYWADKGYIKIAEVKKNDFYLIKLKSLDDDAEYYEQKLFIDLFKNKTKKDFSEFIEKTADNSSFNELYNSLIEKQRNNESLTYVRIKDLRNVFYTTIDSVKNKIKKKYTKKESGRIFTSKSIWAKVLTFMVSTLPFLLGNIAVKAPKTLNMEDAILGGLFWCGVLLTLFIIVDQLIARRKSMKNKSKGVLIIIFTALTALFAFITYIILINDVNDKLTVYISLGSTYIIALFAMFMEKRTPEINKLQEKIIGLRMFLQHAEKDRIERLVDDNPEYFFNILSYAYVLGVTDQWAKQFEDIAMKKPSWFESNTTHAYFLPTNFTRDFTRSVSTMQSAMVSRPSSSGSSGGGGYSGGGGFSGGGGGGGGGGSW